MAHQDTYESDEGTVGKVGSDFFEGTVSLDAEEFKDSQGASLQACIANLVMSVLGAGQLTLPFVFSSLGVGCGLMVFLLFVGLSVYSLFALSFASKKTGLPSCAGLIEHLLGRNVKRLAYFLIGFYAWGGGVSFLIIVKMQLLELRNHWNHNPEHPFWDQDYVYMFFAVLLIVYPLAVLRRLTRLRFTSILGSIAAVWITVTVILNAPWQNSSPGMDYCSFSDLKEGVRMAPQSYESALAAIPLISFALNSSWAYLNVFHTMAKPTGRRVALLISGSSLIIVLNYLPLAIIGYLSFCDSITSNVIDSYDTRELPRMAQYLVLIARVALVVQLCFALPLRFHVTRDVVEQALRTVIKGSTLQHVLVTSVIVWSAAALAATPLSLVIAVGITSAICASFIIYIFPAVMDLVLILHDKSASYRTVRIAMAILSCSVGIFVMVTGLYGNIQLGVVI